MSPVGDRRYYCVLDQGESLIAYTLFKIVFTQTVFGDLPEGETGLARPRLLLKLGGW